MLTHTRQNTLVLSQTPAVPTPLTDPSYHWLEMEIRSRLGHAYLATGRLREAADQFQAVLDAHEARAHRQAP